MKTLLVLALLLAAPARAGAATPCALTVHRLNSHTVEMVATAPQNTWAHFWAAGNGASPQPTLSWYNGGGTRAYATFGRVRSPHYYWLVDGSCTTRRIYVR